MSSDTGKVLKRSKYYPRSVLRRVGCASDEWACPRCTFINTGDACVVCGSPKPEEANSIETTMNPKLYVQKANLQVSKYRNETYCRTNDETFIAPIGRIKNYYSKITKMINFIEC